MKETPGGKTHRGMEESGGGEGRILALYGKPLQRSIH